MIILICTIIWSFWVSTTIWQMDNIPYVNIYNETIVSVKWSTAVQYIDLSIKTNINWYYKWSIKSCKFLEVEKPL